MKIELSKPGHIRVHSGMEINLLDPHPDTILIEDIAHGLSNICRFGGHTKYYSSVAKHSINASIMVDKEHALEALLHDASEAYLGDVTKPLKKMLPDYQEVEDRFMKVIANKFGFNYPMTHEVKEVDNILLKYEWSLDVISTSEVKNSFLKKTKRLIHSIFSKSEKDLYLERFEELTE